MRKIKMKITDLSVFSEIITPSAKSFTAYDMNSAFGTASFRGVLYFPEIKKFVAYTISSDGIYTSSNGITWERPRVQSFGTFNFTGLYVGANSTVYLFDDTYIYKSTDGVAWTELDTGGFVGAPYASIYDEGTGRIILGGTNDELSYTTISDIDAENNVTQYPSKPNDLGTLYGFATNGTLVVGADSDNNQMYYTSDGGDTWGVSNNPFSRNYGVAYSSTLGLWTCVGFNGASYSYDGITWQAGVISGDRWERVIWEPTNEIFVATRNSSGDLIAYSKDGINYTTVYSDASGNARGVAYSTERKIFCAIGDVNENTIMLSTKNSDGVTYYG